MTDIVILGAGATGLSTAYHLEQKIFYNYKLFEKEHTPGGLCRSITTDGFTFDYTGHLLHINDNYFKNFIDTLVGPANLYTINRKSFVYSQDIYTNYPYQINLHGLPLETIAECIEQFISRPKHKKSPKSFYSWVLTHFGSGFGNYFFFPYQEKIFSYNIKKLSASWTSRFVPSTTLKEILAGTLASKQSTLGYNSQFFYPKSGGIQFWINKLIASLKQQIYTNYCVSSVDLTHKVVYFTNNTSVQFKKLINTLPLNDFLRLLKEPAHTNFYALSDKLICNSVVNFNIGLNYINNHIGDKHWIYYPEKKYAFYRLGFPHNFSANLAPEGCNSVYGEFSYINKSPNFINNILKESREQTCKLLTISPENIICQNTLIIKHAYVIYNSWRDNNITAILAALEEFNIYSIGRYGAWKYSSMQEAVLDGRDIVERLLD